MKAEAGCCGLVTDGSEHPYDEVGCAGSAVKAAVGHVGRVRERPLEKLA